MPFSPLRMLLFFLALTFLVVIVQFGLVTIAFDKLGLSADSAYLLLMSTLVGSLLNLPLFSLKSDVAGTPRIPPMLARLMFVKLPPVTDRVIVTINVGGAAGRRPRRHPARSAPARAAGLYRRHAGRADRRRPAAAGRRTQTGFAHRLHRRRRHLRRRVHHRPAGGVAGLNRYSTKSSHPRKTLKPRNESKGYSSFPVAFKVARLIWIYV
jgi:hypothetical protein